MRPSPYLHQLIRSLTSRERRFILSGLKSGKKGDQGLYLRLFLAMEAQAKYDERAIRDSFEGTSFGKSLAFPKSHLYKILLRALEDFHREEGPNAVFRSDLARIGLLLERGFPDQALRLLEKSQLRAESLENALQVVQLLRWKRRLVMRLQGENFAGEIAGIARQEDRWEAALRDEQRATRLHDELYAGFQEVRRKAGGSATGRSEAIRAELETLLRSPALVFGARVAAIRAIAHYHHMREDFEGVHDSYREEIATWEAHPLQIRNDPLRYVRLFGQWLTSKALIGDFEGLLQEIARLRGMQDFGIRSRAEVFQISCNLELYYYINRRRPQEAHSLVPAVARGLEEFGDYLLPSARLGFFYNIALVYWMGHRPEKALKWVHNIMQFDRGEVRKDIRAFAPVLEKILHHELGNTGVLESWFRSFRYRRDKKGKGDGLEALVLDLVRGLLDRNTEEAERTAYTLFLSGLDAHARRPGVSRLGLEELRIWAEGKIKK